MIKIIIGITMVLVSADILIAPNGKSTTLILLAIALVLFELIDIRKVLIRIADMK